MGKHLLPNVCDARVPVRGQYSFCGDGQEHLVGDGEVGAERFFLELLHRVDVLCEYVGLSKESAHLSDDVDSVNGVSPAAEQAQVLHQLESGDPGVLSLGVFELPIPSLVDVGHEERLRAAFAGKIKVEILLDTFVHSLRATSLAIGCILLDGCTVRGWAIGDGEGGAVGLGVGSRRRDDAAEVVFTLDLVVRYGQQEGIYHFLDAGQISVGRLA